MTAKVAPNAHSTERLTYFDPETNRHIVPFVIEPSAGVDRGVLAILSEAYAEEQVKPPPPDRLAAVADALAAFATSAAKSDKLVPATKDALRAETERIAGALATELPAVSALLAMPGADSIEFAKKLRGQAEPLVDDFYRTVLHLQPRVAPIKVAVFPLKKNHAEIVATAKKVRKQLQSTGAMRTIYDDTAAIGRLYRRQDEIGTPFCVTVDFQTLDDATVTVRDRDSMGQIRLAIDELDGFLREKTGRG